MATEEKSDVTKYCKESGAPRTLIATCWNVNSVHHFGSNWPPSMHAHHRPNIMQQLHVWACSQNSAHL